jgi:hypothetical protein
MCGGPAWKREIVPDHKFDFVDTREFTDHGFGMRMKYLWLYAIVLKSFLVYISDIFSAITMLTTSAWHSQVFNNCPDNGCFYIPFKIGRWLFVGCIIFSFLLLAYESRKAKRIIASRDISYAFTNVMANHYYSLRSYDHFCFFDHISNSTKISDDFAFFVFFVFKSWKRLLLADAPRQTINALTLYAIFISKKSEPGAWYNVAKYFQNNSLSTTALIVTTSTTVVVFAGSLLILVVAGICYVPLLCYIRGNLKEYCCHKVDKRIEAVIKRKQRQRLADAAKFAKKEAMGDFTHLKNKKGELIAQPLPQPTLPNLSVDDDVDDSSSYKRPAPSTFTQDTYYYTDSKADYPPMPAYNQPYSTHQPPGAYAYYNPSQATLGQDDPSMQQPVYDDDIDNLSYLPASVPYMQQQQQTFDDEPPLTNPYGGVDANDNYVADPHDVYQGRAVPNDSTRRTSPLSNSHLPSSGLVYDTGSGDAYGRYSQRRHRSNESAGVGGY